MMNSVLNIHANIPTPKVETMLSEIISLKLKDTKIEISGVEIDITMNGKISVRGDQNVVTYHLPLDIHVIRPSGLFTVEGQGKVSMTFQSELNFDRALNIHLKTELLNHKWIEKPQLNLGSLSMPVETLINMILKHTESILIGKIDEAVEGNISIKKLFEEKFYTIATDNDLVKKFGLGADIALEKLDFNLIRMDAEKLAISSQLSGYSNIGNHSSNLVLPQIGFQSEELKNPEFHSSLSLSYDQIVLLANTYQPDLEVGGKKLDFYIKDIFFDDILYIKAVVNSPAKMDVVISGIPSFKNKSMIYFEDLDIQIKAKSILYRLFVPVIKGMVESRFEEYFPVDVKSLFSKIPPPPIKNIDDFNFELSWDQLTLSDVVFNNDGICIEIMANELTMNLTA